MLGLRAAGVEDIDIPGAFFAIGVLAAGLDQFQQIAYSERYAAAVGEHRHHQEQQHARRACTTPGFRPGR